MGCGGSTNNGNMSPDKSGGRKGSIFKRQPKVSIRIGDGVSVLGKKPRVIFVFGEFFSTQFQNNFTPCSSIDALAKLH